MTWKLAKVILQHSWGVVNSQPHQREALLPTAHQAPHSSYYTSYTHHTKTNTYLTTKTLTQKFNYMIHSFTSTFYNSIHRTKIYKPQWKRGNSRKLHGKGTPATQI